MLVLKSEKSECLAQQSGSAQHLRQLGVWSCCGDESSHMQVLKLRAICSHCQKEAAFTHRLGDEKDVEVHMLSLFSACHADFTF